MKLGDVVNPESAHWGKPLDGVRVLALEQMQALPYATQLLGRLGADVVKVEAPGTGDLGRGAVPSMVDPEGRATGATFMRNNLSKRSVVIDLKQPEGRELVLRLAPRFDVVAENFR
ncbi:MAG TPA: CoA transferase, partial [Acidimicrobiales bacterium]